MTTAMDQWAADQEGAGLDEGAHRADVREDDITGSSSHADSTLEEVGDTAVTDEVSPEDAALQAKRAKDKKIMMIAGGVLGAVAIAFGASMFIGSGQPQQVAQPAQQVPMDPNAVAAAAAQASQQQGAGPVVAAAPAESGVAAPVDFGLQMPQTSSAQMAPVVAAAPQFPQPGALATAPAAPAVPAPNVAQPPVPTSPVGIGAAHAATLPSTIGTAPAAAWQAPAQPTQAGKADQTEIDRLRGELAAVRSEFELTVASLRKDLAVVRTSQASRTAAPRAVAPVRVSKAKAEKPFDGITEKAEPIKPAAANPDRYVPVAPTIMTETKATPSAPPAVAKGGKVRGDFTVYAISNGRAWVHWTGDGENHMVSQNSVLPDNSRITSIDDVKGVVFSSAGEIHAKPSK